MAENPACREFVPLLSPYVDGELDPRMRLQVDRHLSNCHDCTARVADFRAEAGWVRVGLDILSDDADFTGFAQKVMARVTPQRPPLLERLGLFFSETWTYQRRPLVGGLAFAVALAVVLPLGWRFQDTANAAPMHLAVRSVRVDPAAHVAPVVMTNDQTGDAIIWLVDHDDQPAVDASSKDEEPDDEDLREPAPGRLPRQRPSGGDL